MHDADMGNGLTVEMAMCDVSVEGASWLARTAARSRFCAVASQSLTLPHLVVGVPQFLVCRKQRRVEMRAINITEIEVALLMSLHHCLYVYGQRCSARRQCLCASTTEWSGGRGRNEAGKCASDERQLLNAHARTTTSVGKEWRKITPVTILCVSEEEQREEVVEEAEEEDVD
ncbi:ATP-dependent RNA Helicase [Echinococcus multilocularis]|uniref:ATP-dependent RNA Helicase n=1 Tax=Echinococcus multilocularis TaxID=6211 RepID=A0A0S4MMP6_ECHMU|nr:ATP-dependent RNA Helicase [Echinococcus multilocularis]